MLALNKYEIERLKKLQLEYNLRQSNIIDIIQAQIDMKNNKYYELKEMIGEDE